jgi:hypothetical protein
MSLAQQNRSWEVTEHGLLVAYGRFARQIGLVDAIEQIPIEMKTVVHSPADKVVELLCHILMGGMHINEVGKSAHPLVRDRVVAQAWGQQSFASSSGVSHLLATISAESVRGLGDALERVIEPYRRCVLGESLPYPMVVDFDLTGLVVSDQATTYEGADWGHVGPGLGEEAVGKGYQFARAQMAGPKDAFVLGGFLHSGRAVAKHCLAELVALTEAQLGRPRRRVEAVAVGLARIEEELAALEAVLAQPLKKGQSERRRQQLGHKREAKQGEAAALRVRLEALAAENAANPNARRIILRLDGAFGNGPDVAWLYEQGYSVVARVHARKVAASLQKEEGLHWEKLSKNLFVAEGKRNILGACPYPLRLFLCRQRRGEKHPDRFSALLTTPDLEAKPWPVRRVGVFYNARQVMEAGIKESKGVFASRHLPTRHQAGLELYEKMVLFAQNLIRWFRRKFVGSTVLAAASVKELVRIGANSRAIITVRDGAASLSFVADSPWQAITIPLRAQLSYQLWFPFLEDASLTAAGP